MHETTPPPTHGPPGRGCCKCRPSSTKPIQAALVGKGLDVRPSPQEQESTGAIIQGTLISFTFLELLVQFTFNTRRFPSFILPISFSLLCTAGCRYCLPFPLCQLVLTHTYCILIKYSLPLRPNTSPPSRNFARNPIFNSL